MTKKLWYLYFIFYLMYISLSRIKVAILRKKSKEAAYEYAYKKVQEISRHVLKKSKTKATIIGLENIPKETCVFIANHQAIFDAFVMMAYIDRPTGFIAKKEIKKIPLISGWLKDSNTIFMDRQNPRDSVKAINAGIENLKNGYSMIIFPEGTRSLGKSMQEFKKGSMKLALKAKVPIVPVSIDGTYKVLETGNQVTGNTIKMMIHKPVYVDKLSKEEENNLAENIQNIVQSGLDKIKA